MNNWNIVHDCDTEDGEATCWSKEVNHPRYGRFVWIEGGNSDRLQLNSDGAKIQYKDDHKPHHQPCGDVL